MAVSSEMVKAGSRGASARAGDDEERGAGESGETSRTWPKDSDSLNSINPPPQSATCQAISPGV